jgi:hypothetical protein
MEGDVMKTFSKTSLVPQFLLAVALLLAPAAYGQGGSISHRYAPPPLDAGSAVANPDYVPDLRPSNYVRPDDQATRAGVYGSERASVEVAGGASGTGFDWADAGIGAASSLGLVLLAAGSAFALRSRRRSLAAT